MGRQCQVCRKSEYANPNLSFHRFPVDPERKKLWLKILEMENKVLPKRCDICSEHFENNYFTYRTDGLRVLRKDAAPKRHIRPLFSKGNRFPDDAKRRKTWLKALKMYSANKWDYICSKHFQSSDYSFRKSNVRILNRNAIPSLPSDSPTMPRFPVDPDRKSLWFSLVGFTQEELLPKYPEICSNHFNPDDIITKANGLRYVKPGANPEPTHSLFSHIEQPTMERETDLDFIQNVPAVGIIPYEELLSENDGLSESASTDTASETEGHLLPQDPSNIVQTPNRANKSAFTDAASESEELLVPSSVTSSVQDSSDRAHILYSAKHSSINQAKTATTILSSGTDVSNMAADSTISGIPRQESRVVKQGPHHQGLILSLPSTYSVMIPPSAPTKPSPYMIQKTTLSSTVQCPKLVPINQTKLRPLLCAPLKLNSTNQSIQAEGTQFITIKQPRHNPGTPHQILYVTSVTSTQPKSSAGQITTPPLNAPKSGQPRPCIEQGTTLLCVVPKLGNELLQSSSKAQRSAGAPCQERTSQPVDTRVIKIEDSPTHEEQTLSASSVTSIQPKTSIGQMTSPLNASKSGQQRPHIQGTTSLWNGFSVVPQLGNELRQSSAKTQMSVRAPCQERTSQPVDTRVIKIEDSPMHEKQTEQTLSAASITEEQLIEMLETESPLLTPELLFCRNAGTSRKRYFGDISLDDLQTQEEKEDFINKGKRIREQRKQIRYFSCANRRLKLRLAKFKKIVNMVAGVCDVSHVTKVLNEKDESEESDSECLPTSSENTQTKECNEVVNPQSELSNDVSTTDEFNPGAYEENETRIDSFDLANQVQINILSDNDATSQNCLEVELKKLAGQDISKSKKIRQLNNNIFMKNTIIADLKSQLNRLKNNIT